VVIDDKLSRVRFTVDQEPHIRVNVQMCETCLEKPCLYVCPVQNYRLREDGGIEFVWQGCLECGACRIACKQCKGAIEWNWPRGGYGVCWRQG